MIGGTADHLFGLAQPSPMTQLHKHQTQTAYLPSVFAFLRKSRNYTGASCTVCGGCREANTHENTTQEVSAAHCLVEHQTHKGSRLVWTLVQSLGRTGLLIS